MATTGRAERKLEQRRRPDGIVPEPVSEPDSHPATVLRELMAEDRRSGWDFDTAFEDNVRFVLGRLTDPHKKRAWKAIFTETKSAWRAGWDRESSTSGSSVASLATPLDSGGGERLMSSARRVA